MTENSSNLPQLPKGWVWTRLGDVGNVGAGGTPSTGDSENFNGDVPWITPADLSGFNGKFISMGRRNLSKKGLSSSSAVLLPAGTVLFSSRAPIGYVAIATNPVSTNQGFKNLTCNDDIFNEYVFYYLKANKTLAESYGSGTTFTEVSASRFAKIPFPLCPLNEQRRIVGRIEELFSCLDAGVESLLKVKTLLKRYRQAVLKYAFEGKLTEEWRKTHKDQTEQAQRLLEHMRRQRDDKEPSVIEESEFSGLPSEWAWARLSEITDSMKNGIYRPKRFYAKDGIACLRMYNIEDGSIVWKDIKRMNLTSGEIQEYELKRGDILVNRVNSRELVGKAAAIPGCLETCVYESKNIRLRLLENLAKSRYVNFWFLFFSQKYFNRNAQQTVGMASINQEQLGLMPVPLCSLPEQQQVVEEMEHHFLIAEKIERNVEQSSMQAERLRQSILGMAFGGKLVPQDLSDEPAEKLLERIRQEREKRNVDVRSRKGLKDMGLMRYVE